MAQMNLNNLKYFTWDGFINEKMFCVEVVALCVADARKELLSILESIDALKQEYDQLKKRQKELLEKQPLPHMRHRQSDEQKLVNARLKEITQSINADFKGILSEFDYHSDATVDTEEVYISLSDYIRQTEPQCISIRVGAVSFRS